MAASPRIVTQDITISWEGMSIFVEKGTIVDIPAGSALETAYGTSNLAPLPSQEQGASSDGDSEPEDN